MSLSKTHSLPIVLVKPRKSWLRTDMTGKLLTGTISLNTNNKRAFEQNYRLKFILLINVKMLTNVGILTFMSRINYWFLSFEPELSTYFDY